MRSNASANHGQARQVVKKRSHVRGWAWIPAGTGTTSKEELVSTNFVWPLCAPQANTMVPPPVRKQRDARVALRQLCSTMCGALRFVFCHAEPPRGRRGQDFDPRTIARRARKTQH